MYADIALHRDIIKIVLCALVGLSKLVDYGIILNKTMVSRCRMLICIHHAGPRCGDMLH